MKRNEFRSFVLILLLGLLIGGEAGADPISPSNTGLYADPRACKEGDILTVLVKVDTDAIQRVRAFSQKESKAGIEYLTDVFSNLFSRALAGNYRDTNNLDDNFNQSFTTTFSAVVSEVLLNGNLVLEGEREVVVNGEKQSLTFSGYIRPQDISRDNTVLSNRIMGLKFRYSGPLPSKGKPGIIRQILQCFF